VFQRISPFALVHVAFAITVDGSASRAGSFEATSRALALPPDHSPPSLGKCCRQVSESRFRHRICYPSNGAPTL